MLRMHWLNLRYLAAHKWYVFRAGRRLGVSWWRLLKHDWTKLTPAEWGPYARKFYGRYPESPDHVSDIVFRAFHVRTAQQVKAEFMAAWRHHVAWNDHHPEYWVRADGYASEMPEQAVREMVADWQGAGAAKGTPGDVHEWYAANKGRFDFHPKTRARVEELLEALAC